MDKEEELSRTRIETRSKDHLENVFSNEAIKVKVKSQRCPMPKGGKREEEGERISRGRKK